MNLQPSLAAEREINAQRVFARTPTRKRERVSAQRFARNRARCDTRAANLAKFFYKRDPLPENCGRLAPEMPAGPPPITTRSSPIIDAHSAIITKFVAVKLW